MKYGGEESINPHPQTLTFNYFKRGFRGQQSLIIKCRPHSTKKLFNTVDPVNVTPVANYKHNSECVCVCVCVYIYIIHTHKINLIFRDGSIQ
jgi:hypothetical protein